MYRNLFKRLIDFILSFFMVICLLPFLIIVSLLIRIDSKGPIFFTQIRVGKGLRKFNVLKLRTMTNEKREVGDIPIIGKAPGVTNLGFFLRRYKIDELPQVFNVLMGDMSIVGPRPSIPEQLEQMTDEEKRRYSVRPGLTGLSQVSGNIHLNWKERYKYDLLYVDNILFLNDLRIVMKTFLIIFLGEEKFLHKSIDLIKRTNENTK